MKRAAAAGVLLSILLAGCASEPPAAPVAEPVKNATFVEDYDLGHVTIEAAALQNASLGEEHRHDAWGEASELLLLEAAVPAGLCEGPIDALFYLGQEALEAEGVNYGCARLFLPEGVVVPEGTGLLRVEIDASDALKAGGMAFQWRSKAHEVEEPPTTEPVHTWEVALDETDWDIPHAPATSFVMYVASHEGPVGAFDGEVRARIVAVRLEGWEPVLAIAHVDHWKLPELHDIVAPGVMRLLDAEATVTNVDPARLSGQNLPEPLPLEDIIAPGTKHVTILAETTSTTCGPALQCWYVPQLRVGGYERLSFGELLYEEGSTRVYRWAVPDDVPEDSVYANVSTAQVNGRIDACLAGDAQGPSCGTVSIASGSATARLLALAWKDDVDVALLKQLAGAAP